MEYLESVGGGVLFQSALRENRSVFSPREVLEPNSGIKLTNRLTFSSWRQGRRRVLWPWLWVDSDNAEEEKIDKHFGLKLGQIEAYG